MSCYTPLTAYYSKDVNPSGKRSLVFDKRASHSGVEVQVPCQQCMGCRLQRALDWGVRCVHESSLHEVNSFITLTYDNKHLPSDGSLDHRDFQLFMKRLRDKSEFKFKFFMCGEYGERNKRPHYHALLFGCDFSDRKYYKTTKAGDRLDTSVLLEETWRKGFCTVGDVSFQSATYVSGYVTKKVTGEMADAHYGDRLPEYCESSNGIGRGWLDKYRERTYAHDHVIVNGKKMRPPRYYDGLYEIVDAERLADVKRVRVRKARLRTQDTSYNAYKARDTIARQKSSVFERDQDDT